MRAERIGDGGERLAQMAASISWLGTLSGTLRSPSMSSEKASRRVLTVDISSKARRTQVVRATSPKVPMCGRPDGRSPSRK